MRIYQIYMPELATFVKFKVLEPESVQSFISSLKLNPEEIGSQQYYISFRKSVIENFIFNLKGDISESLRMMSRKAAEACLDALYTGIIMLNPGLDVDSWVSLSYTPNNNGLFEKEDEDDKIANAFLESIKKVKKGRLSKIWN